MDIKALFNLSYGVFVLGAKDGDVVNACITNTCMQVANEPTRVAIACINKNFTCDLIKKSKAFALSILDESCTFDVIKHFGFQSGRNVNKFADFPYEQDANGSPFLKNYICSVLTCKVCEMHDLGSHTLFIAEVQDAVLKSERAPITYAYYQSTIKPKAQAQTNDKKIVGWRCKICGYEYKEEKLPADFICPMCGHDASDFEPIFG